MIPINVGGRRRKGCGGGLIWVGSIVSVGSVVDGATASVCEGLSVWGLGLMRFLPPKSVPNFGQISNADNLHLRSLNGDVSLLKGFNVSYLPFLTNTLFITVL